MFDRERRTITVDGQAVVLVELSAGDFAAITAETDDTKQGLLLLSRSIESPSVTDDELLNWPNRVITQLLAEALSLNGISSEGN